MNNEIACDEPRTYYKKRSADNVRMVFGSLRDAPPNAPIRNVKSFNNWWEWMEKPVHVHAQIDVWFEQSTRRAITTMVDCVDYSPARLGGIPLLRDTRLSISQLLTEFADSDVVLEIADNFEVDAELVQKFTHALAMYFNRPVSK